MSVCKSFKLATIVGFDSSPLRPESDSSRVAALAVLRYRSHRPPDDAVLTVTDWPDRQVKNKEHVTMHLMKSSVKKPSFHISRHRSGYSTTPWFGCCSCCSLTNVIPLAVGCPAGQLLTVSCFTRSCLCAIRRWPSSDSFL